MAWTIPDKGEGQDNKQSILFQEYLDVLVAGIRGIDCVLSGCAVTAQGSPDMTVAVAKGSVLTNGVLKPVTSGNVTITTANSTLPRIDLVVVDSSGTKAARTGTAAAAPMPPARTANDVVIAAIWVPAADTTISSTQITDMRVLQDSGGCVTLYKTTTAETTNNTSGAIEILNKAGSGVVIPNGLFLAGKIIRVRIAGNYLINSGTPTIKFELLYGGSTLFADTSAACTASATRGAWVVEFDLVAQASNDQAVTGHMQITDPTNARTAPGTGTGELWSSAVNMEGESVFSGGSSVDSDAADRTLSVRWTYNVANSANEVVVESATVELL